MCGKAKDLGWLKQFWKRKIKVGGITWLDVKAYYAAIVIKTVWYLLAKGWIHRSVEINREPTDRPKG